MSDQVKINQFNIEYPDGTSVPAAIELPISAVSGLQAVLSTLQASLATGGRSLGAFDSYQKVVDFLLSVDSVAIAVVGSAIYLKGSATPDLWVAETRLDFQNFTYTTDENFIQYIKDNGRIGRFKISLSEVDLSGYVPREGNATGNYRTYVIKPNNGGDGTLDTSYTPLPGAIPIMGGQTTTGQNAAGATLPVCEPIHPYAVANKKYVDDNFLAKSTATTGYPQIYVKAGDGTQTMYNVSTDVVNGAIPRRQQNGTIFVPATTTYDNAAISKYQADNSYVNKFTSTSGYNRVYGESAAGTQMDLSLQYPNYSYDDSSKHSRNGVPAYYEGNLGCSLPIADYHVANKKYVDGKLAALTLDENNGLNELSFTRTLPTGTVLSQTVKLPDVVSTDQYSCFTNTQFLQFDNIYATGGIQALNGFTVGSRGLTSKTTYKEDKISRALLSPTGTTTCHLLLPDSPGTIATEEYCTGASTKLYKHVFSLAGETFHIISTESQPYTNLSTNIKDTFISGYMHDGMTAILAINISPGGYMTIIYANVMGASDLGYSLADGDYPLDNDVVTPL